MAALVYVLRPELELVQDAIDTLARVGDALIRRHGDAFRSLERDIEALDCADLSLADPHDLGEGYLLFEPPPEITALIDRAHALGVI